MKKGIAGALLCILLLTGAGALAQTVMMDSVFFTEGAYEGFVTDGLPNGYGLYTGYDGKLCMGLFKDGKLSGYGYYFMDQSYNPSYLLMGGSFENFALHGEGVIVTIDGRRTAGQFINGQPVQGATQTSQGTYSAMVSGIPYNGGTYVGEVLASAPAVPHGYGVFNMDYAVGSAAAHSLKFFGEMENGIPRNGMYVDIYSDSYWVTMVTDGVQGEAVQTAFLLSATLQQYSALSAGASCSTCLDTKICPSCKGALMVPSLSGGYGQCPLCSGSGSCPTCSKPETACWSCNGSRVCATCNGAGEYHPIPALAYMQGAEPVRCGICRGTGVCPWCK
ncbi:MAG: hypothetical protein LBM74_04225 [Oscillospiraceae bacterium]|jgi:hypothetical protein|nr:hypothetical protein [Oscillospiraceae bacterium]